MEDILKNYDRANIIATIEIAVFCDNVDLGPKIREVIEESIGKQPIIDEIAKLVNANLIIELNNGFEYAIAFMKLPPEEK